MKQLQLFILIAVFAACGHKKTSSSTAISENVEKMRAFVFVNTDSVRHYNNILKKLCNPEISSQHAILLYGDAILYLTAGIHEKAELCFTEAHPIFEKEKNDLFVAYCELGIGNCSKMKGDADRAILHYLRAIRIFEKIKNQFFVTVCYVNLAETCQQKGDLDNARHYISLAKQSEPYGSKTYMSVLHLEANLYGMTGKIDSAVMTDNSGIALAVQKGYPDKLSPFYENLAQCFTEIKKYDSAEYYYRKCIYADSINGRIQLMADSYANMVNVYGYEKNEQKMEAVAAYAYRLCDSTQYLLGKYAVFDGLNNYYSSTGNLARLVVVKDSLQSVYKRLVNKESEEKAAEYNIEFETSRKEQLISKQQNDLQRATYLTVLLSALALLLIISIAALYRNYKVRRSIAVNRAIQEQKDLNVQSVFESEQAERIRIARDLHDSIGQKLSVLKMYLNGNADMDKMPLLLNDTIREVREISHDLLPEELNFGLLKALNSDIEILRSSGTFKISADLHDAENDEQIPMLTSLNMLRIFRELLSNTVKHSGATEINIMSAVKEKQFTLELNDNGKGFDEKQIAESSGIGWKNIYARINMLKGTIMIARNETGGNIISVKIPFA